MNCWSIVLFLVWSATLAGCGPARSRQGSAWEDRVRATEAWLHAYASEEDPAMESAAGRSVARARAGLALMNQGEVCRSVPYGALIRDTVHGSINLTVSWLSDSDRVPSVYLIDEAGRVVGTHDSFEYPYELPPSLVRTFTYQLTGRAKKAHDTGVADGMYDVVLDCDARSVSQVIFVDAGVGAGVDVYRSIRRDE